MRAELGGVGVIDARGGERHQHVAFGLMRADDVQAVLAGDALRGTMQ
jgi:hypothetical protein